MSANKALVIEDEKPINQLVTTHLRKMGFTTLSANYGSEGIRLAQSEYPDLIILDVGLPDVNGFEILCELKRLKISTRVIVLSGYDPILETAIKCVKLGACDYIVKPFNSEIFYNRVNRAMVLETAKNLKLMSNSPPIIKNVLKMLLKEYEQQVQKYNQLFIQKDEKIREKYEIFQNKLELFHNKKYDDLKNEYSNLTADYHHLEGKYKKELEEKDNCLQNLKSLEKENLDLKTRIEVCDKNFTTLNKKVQNFKNQASWMDILKKLGILLISILLAFIISKILPIPNNYILVLIFITLYILLIIPFHRIKTFNIELFKGKTEIKT